MNTSRLTAWKHLLSEEKIESIANLIRLPCLTVNDAEQTAERILSALRFEFFMEGERAPDVTETKIVAWLRSGVVVENARDAADLIAAGYYLAGPLQNADQRQGGK